MKALAVALALAMCLAGCATIVAGGPDHVMVHTSPPGAYVYVNGQIVGQTPTMITLDRHADSVDVRLYYPGFLAVQLVRYKSFNAWTIGNFFLGLWPIVIDIVTGDWQEFDEDPIRVELTPGQGPPPYGVQPMLSAPQAPAPYPQPR